MIYLLTSCADEAHAHDMISDFPTRRCKHCAGSGKEIDPVATGAVMRALRVRAGKSLRAMAAILKCSPPFLSDMERGNRSFNESWIERYEEALK